MIDIIGSSIFVGGIAYFIWTVIRENLAEARERHLMKGARDAAMEKHKRGY